MDRNGVAKINIVYGATIFGQHSGISTKEKICKKLMKTTGSPKLAGEQVLRAVRKKEDLIQRQKLSHTLDNAAPTTIQNTI